MFDEQTSEQVVYTDYNTHRCASTHTDASIYQAIDINYLSLSPFLDKLVQYCKHTHTLSVQNIKNAFLTLSWTLVSVPQGCWPMFTPMLSRPEHRESLFSMVE